MRYWGTRWRRGILTKNWHWQAAMLARWGNWLLGRGFRTDAEYWRENKMEHRQGDDERGGRKRRGIATNVKFTIECGCCGKHFKRQSPTGTTLKPHKSSEGLTCHGTIGFLR